MLYGWAHQCVWWTGQNLHTKSKFSINYGVICFTTSLSVCGLVWAQSSFLLVGAWTELTRQCFLRVFLCQILGFCQSQTLFITGVRNKRWKKIFCITQAFCFSLQTWFSTLLWLMFYLTCFSHIKGKMISENQFTGSPSLRYSGTINQRPSCHAHHCCFC